MIARLREFWERVIRFVDRDRYTRELEEEMRTHVAMRAQSNIDSGMSPSDARRTAQRRFGSASHLVEASRDVWGAAWLEQRVQDVRIAARGLRRTPGFAIAALAIIALGIAATTSVFSVAYSVLFAPLPIRDADRVVVLYGHNPTGQPEHIPLFGPEYTTFARETRTLSTTAAVQYAGAMPGYLHLSDTIATIHGALVTGAFFDVLGAHPLIGRLLRPDDDLPAAPIPAVISERYWRARFASDPKILGLTAQMGLVRIRIVGVVAGGLDFPRGADFWVSYRSQFPVKDSLPGYHDVIGRLAPGATIDAARSELGAFFAHVEQQHPGSWVLAGVRVEPVALPITEMMVGDVRPVFKVVLGAVLLVLLVTCVNVANLVLLRTMARRRELAVRASLGAGVGRIAQQLLVEAMVLSGVGATIGVGCAWYVVRSFARLAPVQLPRAAEVHLSLPVLLASVALCIVVALVCGCVPMLAMRHTSLVDELRDRATMDAGKSARRTRSILVAAQVAIAVSVLVGATVVGRSFRALAHKNLGFEPEHVLIARVASAVRFTDSNAWYDAFTNTLTKIREVHGVSSVTALSDPPFLVKGSDLEYALPGDDATAHAARPYVDYVGADVDFLRTLGIPLVRGRGFTPDDRRGSERVAIVDDALAHQAWPGRDPIGQRIGAGNIFYTVVGVVAPTRYRDLLAARPTLYTAFAQSSFRGIEVGTPYYVAIRSSLNLAKLVPALRDAVHESDGRLFLADEVPMDNRIDASLATQRLSALLLGAFALAILALAGLGLYSVAATFVRYREFEIGIRIAIGATPWQVVRLVALQGLGIVGAGILCGAIVAFLGGSVLQSLLFGATPHDPLAFGAAIASVTIVALLAFVWPSRRASRANPAEVLRAG